VFTHTQIALNPPTTITMDLTRGFACKPILVAPTSRVEHWHTFSPHDIVKPRHVDVLARAPQRHLVTVVGDIR
jgi:hypothetical protein